MTDNSKTLADIRSEVCNTVYLWAMVAAVPALALSLLRIGVIGWKPVMGVHIGLTAIFATAAWLRPRLPYAVRAGILVAVLFALGLIGYVASVGPGAVAYFVSASIMATVFFGERTGIATAAALLTLIADYIATTHGLLSPPELTSWTNPTSSLMSATAILVVTALPPTVAVLKLKRHLNLARLQAEEASAALSAENLVSRTAEAVHREGEQKLQLALDVANTSTWEINPQTGHIVLDRRWSAMLGGEPHPVEMTFRELSRSVPVEERAAVMAKMAAALKGEQHLYLAEHRVRHRLGHWIWIESRGRIIKRDADGRPLRMIGTNTDITARKTDQHERVLLAETLHTRSLKLADAERLLREMTDGVPGAVYQLEWLEGGGLRFNFMSSGVWDLAGLLPSQATANAANVFNCVRKDDRARLWSLIRERGAQGRPWECEFRVARPDGSWRWTRSVAQSVQSAGRTLWNGYWVDISSIKAAEEELQRERSAAESATLAKSKFLASMSHEIRTPLNGILANSELLALTDLDEEQAKIVGDVEKAGEFLKAVIGNILDFSKIEAGKIVLEFAEVPVDKLVHETIGILQGEARRKGIYLAPWIAPDVPEAISADPTRLRQILLNLLGNAVKFTDEGGVFLAVGVSELQGDSATLRVSVVDSGRGFDQSQAANMFEAFTRTGAAERQIEGTGLGLAISKSLIEVLGGTLTARGEVGVGATFSFTLPIRILRGARTPLPADLSSLKVLVVDAWTPASDWVVDYFIQRRAKIEHAATLTEAVDAARAATASGRSVTYVLVGDLEAAAADRKSIQALWRANTLPIFRATKPANRPWRKWARLGAGLLLSDLESPASLDRNRETVRHGITGRHIEQPPVALQPGARWPELSGLNVLVLEDSALNQSIIKRQLRHLDISWTIASDGREGLAILRQHAFDLVLADCAMPNMDGLEFTRAARRLEQEAGNRRRIPIIALTANAFREDSDKCFAAGMDDFLSKPVSLDRLAGALSRWSGNTADRAGDALASAPDADTREGGPPIEVGVLAELLGESDPSSLATFLQKFVRSARVLYGEAVERANHGAFAALATTAHGAKGEALYVGAKRLGDLYTEIEARAKANSAATSLLAEVGDELNRVEKFILEYIARAP